MATVHAVSNCPTLLCLLFTYFQKNGKKYSFFLFIVTHLRALPTSCFSFSLGGSKDLGI